MEKTYVLDTNVLITDSNSIFAFENSEIVIPLVVLEELDRLKNHPDDRGRAARQVNRLLDDLRKDGNLNRGVRIERSNSTLRVASVDQKTIKKLPLELQDTSRCDNVIIATMMQETHKNKGKSEVRMISKDINVRVKCDALGLPSDDYTKSRLVSEGSVFYTGYDTIDVDDDTMDMLCAEGCVQYAHSYPPNHYVNLRTPSDASRSVLARAKENGYLVRIKEIESAFGLKPRNLEQRFSLDLLFDNSVKLVTLCGASGTGKTLLAVAAGMQHVLENPTKYDRLIITRPVQPVGRDIGFLPGTLQEKMDPWIAPIKDNLDHLCRSKKTRKDEPYLDLLLRNKKIEIEAITYIRGRSIPNSYIIIDEAQNLSLHELKTIITRAGEGSKIVLTGDIEQIDNNHVDMYTNGLTTAVEAFKEYRISGHITLAKGERSELATLASKIL
jgi:PhoH-like ATPase